MAVDSTAPWYTSPFRHIVMPVFFRILYTSGMRVSELRLATLKDVDFDHAMIRARNGKNGKDRLVPIPGISGTMPATKEKIARAIHCGRLLLSSFPGQGMDGQRHLLPLQEIPPQGRNRAYRPRPEVHDFRHTYCVNLLRKWVAGKKDLLAWMPYMTTALGHETFRETAYYLKLTLRSFPQVRDQLSRSIPSVIEDIEDEEDEYY